MNDNFKIFLQAIIDDSNLSDIQKRLAKERLKISADIDFSNFAKNKADIEKQFQALSGIIKNILGDTVSDKQAVQWAKSYVQTINNEVKKLDKIQLSIDTEKYSTQIVSLQQQISKFGIESGESFLQASAALKQLEAAYNDMKFSSGDKRLDYEKEYQKLLEKTKNLITQIKSQKSNEIISNGDNRRISFVNELNNYLQKNTAMTKQSKQQIIDWINTLNVADDMTRGTFDNLKAQFKGLDAELRAANKLGLSWVDKFKQAVEKFGGWAIATGSVMELWNWLRQMPQTIRELDTELVDLRKTTTATSNELRQFYDESNSTAKQLGVTTKEIISQASEWSRLGYAIKDAQTMSKNSAILEAISPDLSIQKATDGLVSTLKAFRLDADDSLDGIISKINIIGNTQAVSNGDIVDILTRSSSAMAAANNTLEQTIALGTAA